MAGEALRLVPKPGDPDAFVPQPRTGRRRRAYGKLSLWKQNALMRELALGEKGPAELGREFGVSHVYVVKFAKQYVYEIAQFKANLDDKFAHLWSADKANRVLVRQRAVQDRLNQRFRTAEDDRTIDQLLTHIAEELGQLPPRSAAVQVTPVHHIYYGFSDDELHAMFNEPAPQELPAPEEPS
jgi:hypothetical protein